MAAGNRNDPYLAFNFLVEIGGLSVGGFSEVTGLQVEVEVQDYREGGQNTFIHKLAGPVRYPSNLVLKRGLVDIDILWGWYQAVLLGFVARQNISVILRDSEGDEKRRWFFVKAYPVRWNGPGLRADSANVAVETLELAHQGFWAVGGLG
jgi:phage tail-like protein